MMAQPAAARAPHVAGRFAQWAAVRSVGGRQVGAPGHIGLPNHYFFITRVISGPTAARDLGLSRALPPGRVQYAPGRHLTVLRVSRCPTDGARLCRGRCGAVGQSRGEDDPPSAARPPGQDFSARRGSPRRCGHRNGTAPPIVPRPVPGSSPHGLLRRAWRVALPRHHRRLDGPALHGPVLS